MPARADTRFSILLPPGWERIPVDDELDNRFDAILAGIIAEAPADRRVSLRTMLEGAIGEALATARERRAVDLILSFGVIEGLPIPASLAVFELDVPPGTGGVQEQLLAFARGGGVAIELDGLPAIRKILDAPGTATSAPHRTISYVTHLPWSGAWLLFSGSIITTDEPGYSDVLLALEGLLDAMMTTVRFPNDEGAA